MSEKIGIFFRKRTRTNTDSILPACLSFHCLASLNFYTFLELLTKALLCTSSGNLRFILDGFKKEEELNIRLNNFFFEDASVKEVFYMHIVNSVKVRMQHGLIMEALIRIF